MKKLLIIIMLSISFFGYANNFSQEEIDRDIEIFFTYKKINEESFKSQNKVGDYQKEIYVGFTGKNKSEEIAYLENEMIKIITKYGLSVNKRIEVVNGIPHISWILDAQKLLSMGSKNKEKKDD